MYDQLFKYDKNTHDSIPLDQRRALSQEYDQNKLLKD